MFAAMVGCLVGASVPGPGFDRTPSPLNLTRWQNRRLMIVTAHPDDAEAFVGGVVHTLTTQLNAMVQFLVVTSGNAGGRCYDASGAYQPPTYACEREEIAFLRRKEMIAGAAALGAAPPWRCGFDDGMLIAYHESMVRERISGFIRNFAPAAIFTHFKDPNWRAPPSCNGACPETGESQKSGWSPQWDDLGFHPDHKDVGKHVFDAVYTIGGSASNSRLFPELSEAGDLAGWQPPELYFFALTRDQPMTHFFPLSEDVLNVKAQALALHRSQYPAPPLVGVKWVASTVADGLSDVEHPPKYAEGFQAWF